MAKGKKRPSERRRRVVRKKRKVEKPSFKRPREWAEAELVGAKEWLARLEGPKGEHFPEGWRLGQIRHYKRHAIKLRAEITELKRQEKKQESEPDKPPSVA